MNRAVFLDRDGVINAMVYYREHGILDSPLNPDEFKLLEGVGEAIKSINEMGMLTVVVSNQPGIAKGKFTLELLEAMTKKMEVELASYGAYLNRVYYCLHHPYAVLPEYRKNCNCRKPKPGLLLRGCRELKIDPQKSYAIGDGLIDIQAGKAIGCRTVLLAKLKCELCHFMEESGIKPDFIVTNLLEAVKFIRQMEGVEYACLY